jgi:hypothetical protein
LETQSDLLAKIDRLQRDMFCMKCIAAMLFLCLTAACLTTWFRHPKTVDAAEFLVRDRAGNVVARLGQLGFGDTCLTLTANGNISVANLCVQNAEGAYLDLHNLKSESRATLTPGFSMYEPITRFQAALGITENGHETASRHARPISLINSAIRTSPIKGNVKRHSSPSARCRHFFCLGIQPNRLNVHS